MDNKNYTDLDNKSLCWEVDSEVALNQGKIQIPIQPHNLGYKGYKKNWTIEIRN